MIFISYSRDDLEFVRYLRALLEGEGFHVWIDEGRLEVGTTWWKEIERNIDACNAFLVVMSPTSEESMYVNNELLRALNQNKPVFPILLRGGGFSMLASLQYEDMTAGLDGRLSAGFLKRLRAHLVTDRPTRVRIGVIQGDITAMPADVAVFKYAKSFHGADAAAAKALSDADVPLEGLSKEIGSYVLQSTAGAIAAQEVLYITTRGVWRFDYGDLRDFTARALAILARERPAMHTISMTVHGVRSGLDEEEAVLAQLGGLLEALQTGAAPAHLETIAIVERDPGRATRIQDVLATYFGAADYAEPAAEGGFFIQLAADTALPDAGEDAVVKSYALALVPADEAFEDYFLYGVQRPVRAAGLLCERGGAHPERLDAEAIEALQERIEAARVLIVDVGGLTPELCLQIGYAWGIGCPTLLISNGTSSLFADAIPYANIRQLEAALVEALAALE